MKGFVGAGVSRFPGSMLGIDNTSCSRVAELWVLVFGASRGASTSAEDCIAFEEKAGRLRRCAHSSIDRFYYECCIWHRCGCCICFLRLLLLLL